jgi:hypothetical protein
MKFSSSVEHVATEHWGSDVIHATRNIAGQKNVAHEVRLGHSSRTTWKVWRWRLLVLDTEQLHRGARLTGPGLDRQLLLVRWFVIERLIECAREAPQKDDRGQGPSGADR